jgi:hypothetical protein
MDAGALLDQGMEEINQDIAANIDHGGCAKSFSKRIL